MSVTNPRRIYHEGKNESESWQCRYLPENAVSGLGKTSLVSQLGPGGPFSPPRSEKIQRQLQTSFVVLMPFVPFNMDHAFCFGM